MPTILSVAKIEPHGERKMDGVDLSPAIFDNQEIDDRPLFWASLSNRGHRSEAMRDGDWRLVVQHPKAKPGTFDNEKLELYHLGRDPSEENNLAETEPKRAAMMQKKIKAWYADTQATATPQPGGWLSAQDQLP